MTVLSVDWLKPFFIVFLDCRKLWGLFGVLNRLFNPLKEVWSKTAFIFGAGYKKIDATMWQLTNFIVGEAKISIYITNKYKLEGRLI